MVCFLVCLFVGAFYFLQRSHWKISMAFMMILCASFVSESWNHDKLNISQERSYVETLTCALQRNRDLYYGPPLNALKVVQPVIFNADLLV